MTNYGSIPAVGDAEEADIVSWNDHRRLVDNEMARNPESMFSSLLQKIQTLETPDLLTPLKTIKDNVTIWMSPEKSSSTLPSSQENPPERSFVGTVGFDDPDEVHEQKRKKFSTPMLLLMLLLLALSGGFLLTNTTGSGGAAASGD